MLNTEWQLSGNIAERYEEFLVPVIFAPWARDLLARAALDPNMKLLDLACGTGIVARMASANGVMATGGDINAAMLAVAEKHAAGAKLSFRHADAQALPFADQSFDAVICQQGLQFFPDRRASAVECLRVLKPGGRAIFCTARGLSENPLMQAQAAAFSQYFGDGAAAPIRAVCAFADADETQSLFADAGFSPVRVDKVVLDLFVEDAVGFVDGMMMATPVADKIGTLESATRQQLRSTIIEEFGACFDGSSLRFPHSANVAVVSRP